MNKTGMKMQLAVLVLMAGFCAGSWAAERIMTLDDYQKSERYQNWFKAVTASFTGHEFESETVRDDYATENRGKAWNFKDGTTCGITYMDPNMKDAKVENGRLKFTMGSNEVVFGWGQLEEKYTAGYVAPLAMQTQGRSWGWSLKALADKATDKEPVTFEGMFFRFGKQAGGWKSQLIKPGVLQSVKEYWPNKGVNQDSYQGFAVKVSAPAGTKIEIDEVSAYRETARTYCRKVFELPENDPVYSAYLNVGMNNAAYINGIQMHDQEDMFGWLEYNAVPLDIKAQLRTGTNVFGLFSELIENGPCTYAVGKIILASGKEISLDTDESYRVTAQTFPGWNAVGFDDSSWNKPRLRNPNGRTYGSSHQPLYCGPIFVENPLFPKLMYDSAQDVQFNVLLPAGCKAQTPAIEFKLVNAESKQEAAKGSLKEFTEKMPAIVFAANAGKLEQGIYELSLSVTMVDGKKNERTIPIMVSGKIAQKEVEGESFEEGMKMTLVDEINCADPNDPHPYMDSEGSKKTNRIVEKNGLKYRETGDKRSRDFYAYKVKIKPEKLFQPHAVDITWPDDAQRSVQIGFHTANSMYSIVGATSFEKFPLSGAYQHFKFFWFPRQEDVYIVVANNMNGTRAAVSNIKIYEVDDIPALKINPSGERFIGQMTERNTDFCTRYDPGPDFSSGYPVVGNKPDFHRRWFKANEWFIKMMRFGGENLLANGVFQYNRGNLGYPPLWPASRTELDLNYQSMLARQFEYHGMSLYDVVEFSNKAGGTESDYHNQGRFIKKQTLASPDGYRDFLKVAGDLADQFKNYKAFKGIQYICYPAMGGGDSIFESMMPSIGGGYVKQMDEKFTTLLFGYDDVMITAFSKEENIQIPVAYDDKDRFQKRYQWIKDNCLEKWIAWRCKKIKEFNDNILAEMHKRRADLKLYATIDFDVFITKPIAKKGVDPVRFLKCAGYDPSLVKDNPFISWTRFYNQMFHHNRSYGITDWPLAEPFNTDPALTAFWDRPTNRSAYILTHFDENFAKPDLAWFTPEFDGFKSIVEKGWPKACIPVGMTFMPPADHCLAAFRDIIRDSDPDTIIFGWSDCTMPVAHLEYLRRISQAFLALPGDKFTPLKGNGLDKNVVVKELRKNGKYYFYILNDTCWDIDVELTLATKSAVTDIGLNKPVSLKDGKLVLKLRPYAMRSFMTEDSSANVSAAATGVSAKGKELTKTVLDDLQTKLAGNKKAQLIFKGPQLDNFNGALTKMQGAVKEDDYASALKGLSSGIVSEFAGYHLNPNENAGSWYVIGCFPGDKFQTGFKKAYPVEEDVMGAKTVDLKKEYKGDEFYEKAVWQKVISQSFQSFDDVVVFHELYGQPDWKEAYAFSRIYSPEDRKCTLQVRSDDGIRVWIDGNLVLDHNIGRSIGGPPDKVEVELKKGWNWVLVKLENVWSGWGFQFKFLKPDGSYYDDMLIACEGDYQA